ncbi:MAG: hypothetical protein E6R03_18180 [Hyphomicrobiaceae bacterium]|nr:MAG: hypothetical protein E6R03_18180 [Hyphomicrobiaceae bacterium]
MMFRRIKGWDEEGKLEWGFNWGIFLFPFRLILSSVSWMIKKIRYCLTWIYYKLVRFVKLLFSGAEWAVIQTGMVLLMILMLRPAVWMIKALRF